MRIIDLSRPVGAADWGAADWGAADWGAADWGDEPLARRPLRPPGPGPAGPRRARLGAAAWPGPAAGEGRPRTLDNAPLDWFFRPGVVLDLTGQPPGAVDAAFLERAMDRIGYRPRPLDVVLLSTGSFRWAGTPRYFTDYVGLDASATDLLADAGVRVVGTDAFSLDAPLDYMIERYERTGDPGVLWPAHFARWDREFCQIHRLANLGLLPPRGFTVACFPITVPYSDAVWARAVAIVDAPL